MPYRINIIGTTGSGKTVLARHLSQKLDIPHIELMPFTGSRTGLKPQPKLSAPK
ncbi:MAG TPA: hypothetical protein VKQ72_22075 [Aggregatilineales bacterium]|nr:hypothetical protein [Aggregatilineales bacterium]